MLTSTMKKARPYLRDARLNAGCVSRGTATLKVPFSPETIGRHERGEVPIEPADIIHYAEGYGSPEILFHYCADCPVGQMIQRPHVTVRDFPFASLRIIHQLRMGWGYAERLEDIFYDGKLDKVEWSAFLEVIQYLLELDANTSDITLCAMHHGIPLSSIKNGVALRQQEQLR